MSNPLEVVDSHECKTIEIFNAGVGKHVIGVHQLSDLYWYWVRCDERGNTADGIGYCPYCGKKL